MRNIEIKCPLPDRSAVEAVLARRGARLEGELIQKDTFFRVPEGWLKLRECDGRAPELISYRRDLSHGPGPSDYDVLLLPEAEKALRLFGRVLPTDGIVEKVRTLWIDGHTRIHLDRVAGLGDHLELECVLRDIDEAAGRVELDGLIDDLGLDRASFLTVPYRDLLRR